MNDITILRNDLEFIRNALSTACNKSRAEDIIDEYRRFGRGVNVSGLTKYLEGALERVELYLAVDEEEENVVSE